jgi:hypothetical protein
MGALTIPELETLHDDFAQVSMVAGMSPHYVEKMDFEMAIPSLEPMSEEMGAALLAPICAAELLDDLGYSGEIPDTLLDDLVLRQKANEVARQIDQITDVDAIPVLSRFVGGLDLDQLGKRETVADMITEKVAILAVHKIVELVGKNAGSVEYDLPEQVTNYIETIKEIKLVMYKLSFLAETHKILEYPLSDVVDADAKWKGQEEMEAVVKKQEELALAGQIFRIVAGDDGQLRRGVSYSQLWAKEGLDDNNVYHLTKEQTIRFLKIGARYFTWYSLLDEKWTGEAEYNYHNDFLEFLNVMNDPQNPNYCGKLIPKYVNDSIVKELEFAYPRMFEDDDENPTEQ